MEIRKIDELVERFPIRVLPKHRQLDVKIAVLKEEGKFLKFEFKNSSLTANFIKRYVQDDSEPTTSQYSTKGDEKKTHEKPMILRYIKNHVRDLFHIPLATLVKGAAILTEDQFIDVVPVAWELLLDQNQETAGSAAAFFILSSVKAPTHASEIMQRALKHKDPNVRIGAILRYQVLWKSRFQVWPRMEEGAHLSFKIPPPGIEFTLPSPKIGIESLPVVDPPWSPRMQNKDMDVTLNQERHVSYPIIN
jgi:hypothetical protein